MRPIFGECGKGHGGQLLASVVLACILAQPAFAQTRAGTAISNTARLDFSIEGAASQVNSNTATLQVAELINVRLVAHVLRVAVVPGRLTAVPFTLTNTGNGREAFCLGAEYDDGTVEGYVVDGDRDGIYDPTHDTLLANGCTDPLDPGESVELLALVRSIHGTLRTLTVIAHPATGTGQPGDVVIGGGDGGSNGVTGPSGTGTAVVTLVPPSSGDPTLEKSQSVLDPWGGAVPAHGAIVTYTLVATFPGFAADAAVTDPVPVGTAYVPGSLTLDDRPLSDAADGDAGSFDGAGIAVSLGEVLTAASHRIQFKVKIQ